MRSLSIGGLIGGIAADRPDAPALLAPGKRTTTYAELAAETGALAMGMRANGVAEGDSVALVCANGPDAATAFLGIASCATCAPLNPAYHAAELEFFLTDLGSRLLVVDSALDTPARDVASRLGIEVIELADAFAEPGPLPGAGSEEVALVLHTSGTTARPKIVPLTHAHLCLSAANIAATLELGEDDRCLNVMPLFHIHGIVGALLSSLAAGGSVACAPGFSANRFFSWLAELRPTWYTAVPTVQASVAERAERDPAGIADHRLRLIRSSSAALPPQIAERLETAFGVPVIEAYGMTEAAHQMASNPLPPARRKPGSVGVAAGPDLGVLDWQGRLQPPGVIGEVAVRGPTIFGGYAGNAEANASSFADGWFRTGDEGHIDADGYLFLRGRLKEIINRGGEKVSPREIDEVLLGHPAVSEAVAFAVPDERLGEEVAAAVVLADGATAGECELQEFVGTRLADFKVPRIIRILDELPRGPTGKLQRIGLARELGIESAVPPSIGARPSEPATPLERSLARLWAEVLEVDQVGLRDSFFALGGDSLLAVEMLARLPEIGIDPEAVPDAVLAWAPTIELLAAWLEAGGGTARSALVPIKPDGARPPLFFVHGLDGGVLFFAAVGEALDPEQPFYGVRAPALEGRVSAPKSVVEMASDYVVEVRRAQPSGPYCLGGICAGALVAIEMARLLEAEGGEVRLVLLVDPRAACREGERYYWSRARFHLRAGGFARAAVRKALAVGSRAERAVFQRGGSVPDAEATAPERFQLSFGEAIRRHRLRPYSGRLAVVQSDAGYPSARWLYQDIARGAFEWEVLAVDHATMFQSDSISLVGATLSEILARA